MRRRREGAMRAGRGDRRWPKELLDVVFSLTEPGKISPVISTQSGYYVVKLMETKESAPRSLAAVRERIRHRLFIAKKADAERRFYEEMKQKVPVRVNRARLEAVEPTHGSKPEKPPALPGQ